MADGRPFWVADFTGTGSGEVLFHDPRDDSWWLGQFSGTQLQWSAAGKTAGFGHAMNDGEPFWVADFTGTGTADVLFYDINEDKWWLGQFNGTQLQWSLAGTTAGFGHGMIDDRPFWVADYTGTGTADVLFYNPSNDSWWLGQFSGTQLQWSLAGNTAGFGRCLPPTRPGVRSRRHPLSLSRPAV